MDIATEEITANNIVEWAKQTRATVIIAYSGGKDSTAMVLKAIESGIPKEQIELWHHDVDGHGEQLFDWPCTTTYCQAFADAMELKILYSYSEGGIAREIYRTKELRQPILFQDEAGSDFTKLEPVYQERYIKTRRMFPAVTGDLKYRWCSASAKIEVMQRAINNTARLDDANILIMTGERRGESPVRSKYNEIEKHRTYNAARTSWIWRPIIDYKCQCDKNFNPATDKDDVWDIIEKWKIQPHPCYELGWSRCSCQLCIFSTPNAWASIKEISPEKVCRISEIETDINFTLYHNKTICEKAAEGKSFIPQDKKGRWMKELLSEFKSDIFIQTWTLPAGAKSKETTGPN